jgi:putative methyltransferase
MRVYINQFNTSTDRNLLPLAAGLLSSYAKKELGDAVEIEIKILRERPDITAAEYEAPDVLAFSCYIWNLRHSLEVARLAKLRFPQALVVVGGPSIPRKPETLERFFTKHPFVDIAVHGEGEITFTEILKCGGDYASVKGISYRDGDGYRKTETRERIRDLDALPSPYMDGTFDTLIKRHGELITGTIWETNRGCPFSCAFCDWGQATQSKVNIYGLDRLQAEIDWIARNNIFYVYAADANFGIKKRDIEIARYMGDKKRTVGSPGFFMINWMKNSHVRTIEIADILRDAGIGCQVTLSMQSFDEETLVAIKRDNIDLDTFRSLKAEYNKRGIATYSELLLGLPGETYASFCAGVTRALSPFPRDHFNIYLCRTLENAEMSEPDYRAKYGIETRWCEVAMARRTNDNVTVNEIEEIIVATKAMPVADWRKSFLFGYMLNCLANLRLANVIINHLRLERGVNVRQYIEYLIDNATGPLRDMVDTLTAFQDSILSSKSSVMQVEGFGPRYWEPHEAAYLVASHDPKTFHNEIEVLTERFLGVNLRDDNALYDIFNSQLRESPLLGGAGTEQTSYLKAA